MKLSRAKEIIRTAQDIKQNWGDNPFKIADYLGINLIFSPAKEPAGKIYKVGNYPAVISISGCTTDAGKIVMCAHELGHFFLHDGINNFDGTYTYDSISDATEHEANLFAVALLFNEEDFNMPIIQMQNYILKGILDYNLP